MSSDIVLSAALRNNLLSLQSTQSLLDTTQLRLASGKKINSALDGAQAFFASKSLTNRATDLERLLDGIGQSVSTIQAADQGVTALTQLVEQADSIAANARDTLQSGSTEAKIVGDKDLSAVTNLTGVSGIANSDTLTFTVTNPTTGAAVTLQSSGVVTIATNDSVDQLVTKINDLNQGLTTAVIEASLNDAGQLEIRSLNGGALRVVADANAGASGDLPLAQALGLGSFVGTETLGGNTIVAATASAGATISTKALYTNTGSTGEFARRSDLLNGLKNSAGSATFSGIDNAGDTLTLQINGVTSSSAIVLNGLTLQGLLDGINNDTSVGSLIDATYDETTGKISIAALDSSVDSVRFLFASNTNNLDLDFGFGAGVTDAAVATTASASEVVRFGSASATLLTLENDFDRVLAQINALVDDSGYRGVNLLKGDDLITTFNEDGTSTLTTSGQSFTSSGLGIGAADFGRASTITQTLSEISDALTTIRSYGSTLSTNLAVIQTREEFTKSLINTVKSGSDKLILADQNEEGAKLIALQTRQQLGVTALSLASQAQQSILRLF